jgi:NAD+ synthase
MKDKIVSWIKEQVDRAGKKGILFGLSGGLDSTVLASLAKRALGENTMGLILPCESNPEDARLAERIAGEFKLKTKKVILDNLYNEFVGINPVSSPMARANLKPRLRMMVLYYFAGTMDYLVAGTGNKSEFAIGYFTKHGDGGVDILPLGGLLKTEIRELARELEIPSDILNRPPSAGLWEGQTDEKEMGVTYDELDKAIIAIEKKQTKGIDGKTLKKVKKMIANSEHKRARVPVFEK